MQDEELDKLINDAANQHHPPYNDKAWANMAVLLDKHMPQNKRRRRPVIFWLLFFLLSSGLTIGLLKPWRHPQTTATHNTSNGKTSPTATPDNNSTTAAHKTNAAATKVTVNNPAEKAVIETPNNLTTPNRNKIAVQLKRNSTAHTKSHSANNENNVPPQLFSSTKNIKHTKNKSVIKIKNPFVDLENSNQTVKTITNIKNSVPAAASLAGNDTGNTITIEGPAVPGIQKTDTNTTAQPQQEKKDSTTTTLQAGLTLTKQKKKPSNKSFAGNFAFTFSAATEASFISLNHTGAIQAVYGAGAAYAIAKRMVITTGFYSTNKIYAATPGQYKFPNNIPHPNLTGVDAVCKVYEIPIGISYQFKQHNKHNWVVAAGMATVIMKKETYTYQYKTPAGQYYSYEKIYNNQNQHYLSVMSISGGYQYELSKRVSMLAGPYFKIPVSGLGAGMVKLGSAGILFSASIKPFLKK